jgi:hypothetical protein
MNLKKEALIISVITGAHSIIYSKKPEADRAFTRDVLKLPSVDSGDGWLIFGLPPSQVAFHDSAKNNVEEFYLISDDIEALVVEMKKHKVKCSPVQRQLWGLLTKLKLPGGGNLKIYQPLHVRPKTTEPRKRAESSVMPKATAKKATPDEHPEERYIFYRLHLRCWISDRV